MSISADLSGVADEFAGDAASFVAAVESIAAGSDPGSAVSVLILSLSGILATGARLGAQEDIGSLAGDVDARRAAAAGEAKPGGLRSALREQFGAVDDYHEVVDPYLGDEIAGARVSDDLADICGDLLAGLALYTDGRAEDALSWWQFSYLSTWGPAASSALRAVQSLAAVVRLGATMGAPGDDPVR